jgi:hypothetical protein
MLEEIVGCLPVPEEETVASMVQVGIALQGGVPQLLALL